MNAYENIKEVGEKYTCICLHIRVYYAIYVIVCVIRYPRISKSGGGKTFDTYKAEMEQCPLYTFRHPTDNQLNAALMIEINLVCCSGESVEIASASFGRIVVSALVLEM